MSGLTHHDELYAMIDRNDDFVLVDVLPEESFLKHHLPGAINIPAHSENFHIMAEKLIPDKSIPVIVYSARTEDKASVKAATRLNELGYKNVSDFENGLEEWMALGYELDE